MVGFVLPWFEQAYRTVCEVRKCLSLSRQRSFQIFFSSSIESLIYYTKWLLKKEGFVPAGRLVTRAPIILPRAQMWLCRLTAAVSMSG